MPPLINFNWKRDKKKREKLRENPERNHVQMKTKIIYILKSHVDFVNIYFFSFDYFIKKKYHRAFIIVGFELLSLSVWISVSVCTHFRFE